MSFRSDINKIRMEIELVELDNKNDVDLLRLFGNETCFKILMNLPVDIDIIGSEYELEYREYLKELEETPNPPNLSVLLGDDLNNEIMSADFEFEWKY